MTWKNILKAPLPIDARANRDANYKTKIIQYEENVIQPAFENYVAGKQAGEKYVLRVHVSRTEPADGMKNQTFIIGTESGKELGNNEKFILETIKEVYDKEGYTTAIKTYSDGLELEISQP